jgi:hypothetical protein
MTTEPSVQQTDCSRAAHSHVGLWPIATGGILPARRRFQSIADMDRFSSRNDLQPGGPATPWLPKPPFRERLSLGHLRRMARPSGAGGR